MGRHARHEFSANLERGCSVCRALLHAGQRQADLPHGVEVNCAPVFLRGFDLLRRSSSRLIRTLMFVRPELCRSEGLQPAQARMPAVPLIQSQGHRLVRPANPLRVCPILEWSACSGTHAASSGGVLSSGEPYSIIRSAFRLVP